MTTPYTLSPEKMEKELAALAGQTITIPRETFDAMLEVLDQSPSIEHSLPNREVCTCSQCDFFRLRKAALSAAKAVSEPTIKESFTVAEQSAELDAGMAAQHYCRGLWGAARGHSDWRKVHEHFANGYKQGCYDNEMANGPNPWPDEHPQASEPAEWKLVPVEPTPEMCDAGADYMNSPTGLIAKNAHYFYKAMLAAAPEATK